MDDRTRFGFIGFRPHPPFCPPYPSSESLQALNSKGAELDREADSWFYPYHPHQHSPGPWAPPPSSPHRPYWGPPPFGPDGCRPPFPGDPGVQGAFWEAGKTRELHGAGDNFAREQSRGEQNDYSQHFVDTGLRPQNFIRDLEAGDRFEEYPKLKELITRKEELIAARASPPMYLKADLRDLELSPSTFGTRFDVILIDPPWEEYVRRAPGVADVSGFWHPHEIANLKIEALADTPSFVFLWVGNAEGLEWGRTCLKKWGFRRCEDICWIKTNKEKRGDRLRGGGGSLLQPSKEHCLMGIRGTVRRSTDAHLIHANVDTDVIIAEEPPVGSTEKPEELYRLIEHFAQGRRRLELFGRDGNIRAGWVTVGNELSSSNFSPEAYAKNFMDPEGRSSAGGRGGNMVPDAPHLLGFNAEIESLRPKSPPHRNHVQVPLPQATSTH